MESDIIVEGFRLSEQTHGLRYMRIIGDGDSSVADNLQQCVTYGPFIKKIECANHAYKCYRSKLESLAKDHPEFRGKGVWRNELYNDWQLVLVLQLECTAKLRMSVNSGMI